MPFATKLKPEESVDIDGVQFKFKGFADGKACVVVIGNDGKAILIRNPDESVKKEVPASKMLD